MYIRRCACQDAEFCKVRVQFLVNAISGRKSPTVWTLNQEDQRWFGTHCEIISATIALKAFLSCHTDSLVQAPE